MKKLSNTVAEVKAEASNFFEKENSTQMIFCEF